MNTNSDASDSTRRLNDEEMVPTGVRLPIGLKSRAKAYATLHHMTLAQFLAEGMELFMERRKDDGKPGNTGFEAEEQENERL